MNIIIFILFLHWVGDFILQSDYVAKNKSKNVRVLFFHVLMYSGPMAILTALGIPWWYAVLNSALHFVTDLFTSRWTSRLWADGKVHWFFVVIGLDQFIHGACLLITLQLVRP